MKIYLASASPRRHEILNQMGVPHDVLIVPAPPGEDEPRLPGETPQNYVIRTAHDKAQRALDWVNSDQLPFHPILTADTTVSVDDIILGKPTDETAARLMLQQLSGRSHQVQTVVTLSTRQLRLEAVCTTEVTFARLSANDIATYCASSEPWGKAGGYGIQGNASMFIERINGSYSGVMGLPIYETACLLREAGLRCGAV